VSLSPTDTHAHLSYLEARGIDLGELFGSWRAAGGGLIVDIGTEAGDLAGRRRAVSRGLGSAGLDPDSIFAAAMRRPAPQELPAGHASTPDFGIGFTAGIWPSEEAARDREKALVGLKEDLEDGSLLALGECGLDYHWSPGTRREQLELFEAQARMADSLRLPLVVHSRDAFDDTLSLLAAVLPSRRGVIHCFSYGAREAKDFVDLGFMVSFAGNLTYKNAENLREAARAVPASMVLAETDAPYLAPVPRRGKASSPADVALTIDFLARLLGKAPEELGEIVAANARSLFTRPISP
jgi:TatD DNase family protein